MINDDNKPPLHVLVYNCTHKKQQITCDTTRQKNPTTGGRILLLRHCNSNPLITHSSNIHIPVTAITSTSTTRP
jgi:hypothetical protein